MDFFLYLVFLVLFFGGYSTYKKSLILGLIDGTSYSKHFSHIFLSETIGEILSYLLYDQLATNTCSKQIIFICIIIILNCFIFQFISSLPISFLFSVIAICYNLIDISRRNIFEKMSSSSYDWVIVEYVILFSTSLGMLGLNLPRRIIAPLTIMFINSSNYPLFFIEKQRGKIILNAQSVMQIYDKYEIEFWGMALCFVIECLFYNYLFVLYKMLQYNLEELPFILFIFTLGLIIEKILGSFLRNKMNITYILLLCIINSICLNLFFFSEHLLNMTIILQGFLNATIRKYFLEKCLVDNPEGGFLVFKKIKTISLFIAILIGNFSFKLFHYGFLPLIPLIYLILIIINY